MYTQHMSSLSAYEAAPCCLQQWVGSGGARSHQLFLIAKPTRYVAQPDAANTVNTKDTYKGRGEGGGGRGGRGRWEKGRTERKWKKVLGRKGGGRGEWRREGKSERKESKSERGGQR